MASSPSLLTLPAELILRILEDLDYFSILTCKGICHGLKALIDRSAALQYTVALATAGQQDGSSSRLSTAVRSKMLADHQDAWRKLEWSEHTSLPMKSGGVWELYGGVFAESSRDRETLFFRQLPSRLRGIETREWHVDVGFHIRDFGMDPSQDLLVALQVDIPHEMCKIHLRSMSTGAAHPSSTNPSVLQHPIEDTNQNWEYSIIISGDCLGIMSKTVDGAEVDNQLALWNWKTGKVMMWLSGYDLKSFVFLDRRFVLVGHFNGGPSPGSIPGLAVYDLNVMSPQKCHIKIAPFRHYLTLPALDEDAFLLNLRIRSDPAPAWEPSSDLAVPFHTKHEERLFAITMLGITPTRARTLDLFVNSQYILELARGPSPPFSVVPWDQWGPHHSRALAHRPNWTAWVCHVYGMKFVEPAPVERAGTLILQIMDFHPIRVERVRRGELAEEGWTLVTIGNRVPKGWLQSIDVETDLPFLIKEIPLPPEVGDAAETFMISEDTLIALEEQSVPRMMHMLTF